MPLNVKDKVVFITLPNVDFPESFTALGPSVTSVDMLSSYVSRVLT